MFHTSCSRKRGIASEAMVEKALQQLITKGEEIDNDTRIIDFSKSAPNGRRDRDGIDFIVTLDEVGPIPIQVKSSDKQRRRFERRKRWSTLFIPVIVVNWWEDIEKIIEKVKKCLRLVLSTMRRKINEELHRERIKVMKRLKQRFIRHHSPCMCH